DRDGNTWYSTLGSGIYMRPRREVSSYSFDKNHFLFDDNILSLLPVNDTQVIAGFNSGIMQIIENNTVHPGYLENSLINRSRILQMYNDKRGRIWVATDLGIKAFSSDLNRNLKLENYFLRTTLGNNVNGAMKAVTSSSKGDVTFAEADGLYILPEGKGNEFHPLATSVIPRQRVSSVFYDHADNLWFANNDGLCKYANGKLTRSWESNVLLSGKIKDIKETKDSILLIASSGKGIILMKNDSVIGTISVSNGLESNYVRFIALDDATVFLATNRGISRLLLRRGICYGISNYGSSYGIISEDVNSVAVNKKYIYVATSQGLTVLEKPLKFSPILATNVYIKSLKIDDQPVDPSLRFNVPYNFRNIAIDFSSPVYINADKVKFRYRFTGNQSWAVTLSNKIDLYGLQNGKYAFEVQAKRSDSEWGTVTALKFTVMPPFWKTWWFIFLVSALFVTISYFLIRRIVTRKFRERIRVLNEQQSLELERRRISSDMHDDLGSDLTNIVIMSRVARQTAETSTVDYIVLQSIEQASNDVINKMNEIIWALNPGNDTLDNLIAYLRNYANAFCELHNIELLIAATTVTDAIDIKASFRRNIFLSVKESLRNITRHASATSVSINIIVDLQSHNMKVSIEDNGTGIIDNKKESYFAGNGLVNIKKRMSEISGTVDISSVKGTGTTIKLNSYF
ncbi:MAG: histidine kinase, partial [Bacteroidota bacterium]